MHQVYFCGWSAPPIILASLPPQLLSAAGDGDRPDSGLVLQNAHVAGGFSDHAKSADYQTEMLLSGCFSPTHCLSPRVPDGEPLVCRSCASLRRQIHRRVFSFNTLERGLLRPGRLHKVVWLAISRSNSRVARQSFGRSSSGVLSVCRATQNAARTVFTFDEWHGFGALGRDRLVKRPTTLQPRKTSSSSVTNSTDRIDLGTTGEELIPECRRTAVMPGVRADTVPENVAPGQIRPCAAAENREGSRCAAHPRIGLRAPPRCRR